MEGFVHFAQNTVKAVSEILSFPISVSDEDGYIIGDTNPSRIGTIHSPSIEVIKENQVILFTEEKVAKMENVLPGVAVPLNFDNKPVGVLGIIGNPDEVEPFGILVKRYVEMMWQETLRMQTENLEAMTLESFVQYLLLNNNVSQEQISDYCNLLHIEPSPKRTCIIVDIGDYLLRNVQEKQKSLALEQLKKTLLNCVTRVFDGDQRSVCAFLNTERIVLLKSFRDEENSLTFMKNFRNRSEHLINMLEGYSVNNVAVASGNSCPSIEHIKQSYLEADTLMKFGQQLNITPSIFSYYDWEMLLAMLPYHIDPDMRKILIKRLEPLMQDDAFDMLKHNFIVYCNHNMNISKAAKELFIHRNTLIYRLKKIDDITGLCTNRFEHCTLLYFALK